MAKVVFIIAKKGFRDEELLETKAVLEKTHEVHIASTEAGACTGSLGAKAHAGLTLAQALDMLDQWSAVVFVGGPGVVDLFNDPFALKLAQQAAACPAVRVLASICHAGVLLAKADVLRGKQATCWDDGTGMQHNQLRKAGATVPDRHVVTDGKLVTADGPNVALLFGEEIARRL